MFGALITKACNYDDHDDYSVVCEAETAEAVMAEAVSEASYCDRCQHRFFLLGEDLTSHFLAARAAAITAWKKRVAAEQEKEQEEHKVSELKRLQKNLDDLESGAELRRVKRRIKELSG